MMDICPPIKMMDMMDICPPIRMMDMMDICPSVRIKIFPDLTLDQVKVTGKSSDPIRKILVIYDIFVFT